MRNFLLIAQDLSLLRERARASAWKQSGEHASASGWAGKSFIGSADSAAACAVPELMAALQRALCSGAESEVQALDHSLREFLRWSARFPEPAAVKLATGLRNDTRNTCSGPSRKRGTPSSRGSSG